MPFLSSRQFLLFFLFSSHGNLHAIFFFFCFFYSVARSRSRRFCATLKAQSNDVSSYPYPPPPPSSHRPISFFFLSQYFLYIRGFTFFIFPPVVPFVLSLNYAHDGTLTFFRYYLNLRQFVPSTGCYYYYHYYFYFRSWLTNYNYTISIPAILPTFPLFFFLPILFRPCAAFGGSDGDDGSGGVDPQRRTACFLHFFISPLSLFYFIFYSSLSIH